MSAELIEQWSFIYVRGDYDLRHLPEENDIGTTYATREEAERDVALVVSNNVARGYGVSVDDYAIVSRYVTPWETRTRVIEESK